MTMPWIGATPSVATARRWWMDPGTDGAGPSIHWASGFLSGVATLVGRWDAASASVKPVSLDGYYYGGSVLPLATS